MSTPTVRTPRRRTRTVLGALIAAALVAFGGATASPAAAIPPPTAMTTVTATPAAPATLNESATVQVQWVSPVVLTDFEYTVAIGASTFGPYSSVGPDLSKNLVVTVPASSMTNTRMPVTVTVTRADGSPSLIGATTFSAARATTSITVSGAEQSPAYTTATATATVTANGRPVEGAVVSFFFLNIGGTPERLGEATTDGAGAATVQYDAGPAMQPLFADFVPPKILTAVVGEGWWWTSASATQYRLVDTNVGTWTLDTPDQAIAGDTVTVRAVAPASLPSQISAGTIRMQRDGTEVATGTFTTTPDGYVVEFPLTVPAAGLGTEMLTLTYDDGTLGGGVTVPSITLPPRHRSIEWVATPTSTSLALSHESRPFGGQTTATATVTGPDGPGTGAVTFSAGGVAIGTATLVDGQAQFILPTDLAAGAHDITASYGGDALLAPSSATRTLTITTLPSTLTVEASKTDVHPGDTITLTATLCVPASAGRAPNGDLGLTYAGTTAVVTATAKPADGDTACVIGTRVVTVTDEGTFDVAAAFAGDDAFSPASATGTSVTATRIPVTMTVTPATSDAHPGELVDVTARVCADGDTTVTLAGDVTLNGAAVSMTVDGDCLVGVTQVTAGEPGPLSLAATFTSTSATFADGAGSSAVTVTLIPVTATLSASPRTAHPGQLVELTVQLCPAGRTDVAFGGTVIFALDGEIVDTITVADAATDDCVPLTTTVTAGATGAHDASLSFTALSPYASTSDTRRAIFEVEAWRTAATGTLTPASIEAGGEATFTVQVTATTSTQRATRATTPTPTGRVVLVVDGRTTGTSTALTDGSASLAVPATTSGTYAVSAMYIPDSDAFRGAETAVSSLVVAPLPTPTESTPAPTPTPTTAAPTPAATTAVPAPTVTPAALPATGVPGSTPLFATLGAAALILGALALVRTRRSARR